MRAIQYTDSYRGFFNLKTLHQEQQWLKNVAFYSVVKCPDFNKPCPNQTLCDWLTYSKLLLTFLCRYKWIFHKKPRDWFMDCYTSQGMTEQPKRRPDDWENRKIFLQFCHETPVAWLTNGTNCLFLFTSYRELNCLELNRSSLSQLVNKDVNTFFATRMLLIKTFVHWLEQVKHVDQSDIDLSAPLKLERVNKEHKNYALKQSNILQLSFKCFIELNLNWCLQSLKCSDTYVS